MTVCENLWGLVSFAVAFYILGDTPFGVKLVALILTVCGVVLLRKED